MSASPFGLTGMLIIYKKIVLVFGYIDIGSFEKLILGNKITSK
jgi:hypothetical protein